MKSKTHTYIDCTEFNSWGADLLNSALLGYIDNTRHEASTMYFHVVITTFAIEALTDIGNFEDIHYTWLVGDYSSGVINHGTKDFEDKMRAVWLLYKEAVRKLLSTHIVIENLKAYTCTFTGSNTLSVSDIAVDVVNDSIVEIF